MAADSTLPDSAETRSSLREDGGERSGATRRDRGRKLDAVGEIDRVIRALAETTMDHVLDGWAGEKINPHDPKEALRAIEAAGLDEFDAIWEKVTEIHHKEVRLKLQAATIYHLKAGKDLALACQMARELVPLTGEPPSEPLMGISYVEDEGLRLLKQLWEIGEPSITEALDLYRKVGSDEERSFMKSELGWYGNHLSEMESRLQALAAAGYRLSWDETEAILGQMSGVMTLGGDEVLRGDQERRTRLHEVALSLEKQGVLAAGAHELPLAEMGRYEPKVFFSMVPSEDRQDLLAKDHFDQVTRAIAQEQPGYFFGSEGLANLPEGKISLALCAWCKNDPVAAEAWYAAHQSSVTEPQQELIREGFAKLAGDRQAFDEPQIYRLPDPEMREGK